MAQQRKCIKHKTTFEERLEEAIKFKEVAEKQLPVISGGAVAGGARSGWHLGLQDVFVDWNG